MNVPKPGKAIKVICINNEHYQGTVVDLDWLTDHQFGLSTGIKDFPVRVIDIKDVVSIDGANIEHGKDTANTVKNVPGSKPNVFYQVSYENGRGIHCTCHGFTFRKQCRHL